MQQPPMGSGLLAKHKNLQRSLDEFNFSMGNETLNAADLSPFDSTLTKSLTAENTGRKISNPLMDLLNVLSERKTSNKTSSCDSRHFCELSRLGGNPRASVLNKMLWKLANG